MTKSTGRTRATWIRAKSAIASRAWWTAQISFRRAFTLILLITVPVAMLAVPSKVSVDGIFYVLGAKTLFTPEFATLYPLFREPGYSAFLSAIHLFSGASLVVVGVQAALLAFAMFAGLYVVHRALGRTTITRYVFIIGLAFTLNPIYFTYAGHFMQQPFFAGLLACYAVLVEWSRKQPPRVKKWQVFALIVVLNIVTIWSSIGWLYLGLFATLLALCYLFLPTVWRLRRRGVRIISAVLLVGVISGATLAADRAIYAGWERLRDAQTATNAINPVVLKPLEEAPGLPSPGKALSLYSTLVGIGITEPYPKENDQFLAEQMRVRFYHSEWDTAYVREPYTSAALGYFALDDPSIVAHTIYALGSQPIAGFTVAGVAYSTVMVLGHAVLIIAFVRRQWFVGALLLIPVSWLAVYALSNTPIDRYGIPAYPLLAGAVALACDHLWWTRKQEEAK
jgi:hypothetical protein